MAAERLAETCATLIAAGRRADEPAALIQWATTDKQARVIGTIGTISEDAAAAGIGPPSTLVCGPTVALAERIDGAALRKA